ncbi:MAG: Uma2 family endonuclease [Gemmataceae bacterium]
MTTLILDTLPYEAAERNLERQTELRFKRFTLAQYQSMVEKGILTKEDKVELLNGWITNKMTINPRHSYTVRLLTTFLFGQLPPLYQLQIQQPVQIQDRESQPEPDLCIFRGGLGDYVDSHIPVAAVALIIEVSGSSYPIDSKAKLSLYAAAGIPQYWIVNLAEERFEIYSDPESASARYRQRADFGRGTTVPVVLGGVSLGQLAVDTILPPSQARAEA